MNPKTIMQKYIEDYPIPITAERTEIILYQMKNCICKIYMDDGSKGTGFFCKIPYPNKDHLLAVLVTNNHVINESHLGNDKSIYFSIDNDKIKNRIIIGDRKVYTSELYDTTIIEIYEDKDNINYFLGLDFDINEKDCNDIYINKSVYTLQYPNNERVSVSYGIIKDTSKNYDIFHLCSTDKGSSGSPILNINTNKIIGIHKGTYSNQNYNKGILLFYPFKEFLSQMEENNKNNMIKKFVLKPSFKTMIIRDVTLEGLPFKKVQHDIVDIDYMNYNKNIDIGFQIIGLIKDTVYGVIEGPPNTYYENGFFIFTIKITHRYPFEPPLFYFLTPIFHPNIDEFGLVSIDILMCQWSMCLCLDKIILSVQSILDDPNVDGFVNAHAAKLFKENKKEYENTVRQYISEFANLNTIQNEIKKLNFDVELNVG